MLTERTFKAHKIVNVDRLRYKRNKLKVIGAYKDYYLLEDGRGRKHSLLKVDYHLKEWKYEEVI